MIVIDYLGIIFIIITFVILKDTHIKVYEREWSRGWNVVEEYDFQVKVWMLLLMVILYIIPIFNILCFISFMVYYLVHALWDVYSCSGTTHKFSLRRSNKIIKLLDKSI